MNNPTLPSFDARRKIFWWEWQQLARQGCICSNWDSLYISDNTDISLIRNVIFKGTVSLGNISREERPDAVIENATIDNCVTGDNPRIRNVASHLLNCLICNNVTIENVGRIEYEPESECGMGTMVNVLDESGSRPVRIYPGMSAQMAALMARLPRFAEDTLFPLVRFHIDSLEFRAFIGDNAEIRDCGTLINVAVWPDAVIRGARNLVNGCVVNNAMSSRPLAFIGSGVDAENFILEDGILDSGALVRNCYIGQGARLEKGFTAHDSLFFANCSLENGEACAMFAGPYTVSMHKASLLIGCMTSFMNAGSATNQSNHMYKLGPVHWGILERGVKTSSNSYLMLGAKIGAFSLLMGDHKTHPDSSEFPFSYLFGDEKGATVVVPAMMLRSCGLLRDELKWPTRDRRLKRKLPLLDRINFSVLNPHTVSHILSALDTISTLMARPADDDRYVRYKGMKLTRASLERARHIYTLAIYKYLHTRIGDNEFPKLSDPSKAEEIASRRWIDLSGQIIAADTLRAAIDEDSIPEIENALTKAADSFVNDELEWIAARLGPKWGAIPQIIAHEAAKFDEMVEEDRQSYREQLSEENRMLSLF